MEQEPIFTERMRRYVDSFKQDNYFERRHTFEYNVICIFTMISMFLGAASYSSNKSKLPSLEQKVIPASTNTYILPNLR
jgi:hypothetical protein